MIVGATIPGAIHDRARDFCVPSALLLFENESPPGVPTDDVREISNYVDAMQYDLKRLPSGFPLSLR